MDYEELYVQLQSIEKDLRDKLTAAQKCLRNLSRNSDKGDLKSLSKDLTQMGNFIEDYKLLIDKYSEISENFNGKEYLENGDFAQQMIEYCENLLVDIKGTYPTYEIFPSKLKIDSENVELTVDRKKMQCIRPLYLVKKLKQNREKLTKASFSASAFLNELADAYDTALVHKAKVSRATNDEQEVNLRDLYNYLVPMQRFRRDYDMQSYAFDLSRLYSSDIETTKDGRFFYIGTVRKSTKVIRILDKDGNEHLLGTIRFFRR